MNRSLIYRATTSDPSGHISEYQINQIVQLTYDADPSTIPQVVSFIGHRLSKPDIYIKTRCCRLVRHLAERGKVDFRRLAQRELVDQLRSLTSHTAAPHATKGMEPVRQLRQAAQEALAALFAQENSTAPEAATSPSPSRRIEGFGASGSVSPGLPVDVEPGPCVSTGRMVGFGNVDYSDTGSGSGMSGLSFRNIIDTISSKLPPIANSIKWNPRLGGANTSFNKHTDDLCTYADNPNANTWNRPVAWNVPASQPEPRLPVVSQRSATPEAQSSVQNSEAFNFRQGRDLRNKSCLTPNRGVLSSRLATDESPPPRIHSSSEITSGEPGDFELALVERLTEPGGLKLAPARKALDEFRVKCETLDLTAVLMAIFGKLDDESLQWQQRFRCLCVLEALLKPQDQLAKASQNFIKERPAYLEAIQLLEQHHSCRLAAKEVVSLLGGAVSVSAGRRAFPASSPVAAVPQKREGSVSLLDLDDDRATSQSEAIEQREETSANESERSSVRDGVSLLLDLGTQAGSEDGSAENHTHTSKEPPETATTHFPFVFGTTSVDDRGGSSNNSKLADLL